MFPGSKKTKNTLKAGIWPVDPSGVQLFLPVGKGLLCLVALLPEDPH